MGKFSHFLNDMNTRLCAPRTTGHYPFRKAQRIKLASELKKKIHQQNLLHHHLEMGSTPADYALLAYKLVRVLKRLVEMGNTVVVVEHNIDVVKNADHIIDLGPEGRAHGGK